MDAYDFILKELMNAGDLLMHLRREAFTTSGKDGNPRNIVTSVDHAVNDALTKAIQAAYPDDLIYSEETAGSAVEGVRLWTIDPIDGSSNFSRGIPHFCITIALLIDGVPEAGGVYNPVTKELFSFKRGVGAFCNGERIEVSAIQDLSDSFILFHAGRREGLREWGGRGYEALLGSAKKVSNLASTLLDTCFVAAGRIEGSVYGTFSTLDAAASIGILREAGGEVYDEEGNPARFSASPQKTYATNNREVYEALHALL